MDFVGLFSIPMWLVILLTLVVLYYIYSSRQFGVFQGMGVDGPKPWPIIGNVNFRKAFIESQEELRQTYGRIYGLYEGMHPLLMVGDCDMLREITVNEFSNFRNRKKFRMPKIMMSDRVSEPPVTDFLPMAEDDNWRHNRNAVAPVFSSGKLKRLWLQMTDMITDAGETMVKWLKVKAVNGKPVEMKEHTGAFTMDVIAVTVFGIKLDTQSTPNDPFIKYAKKIFSGSSITYTILLFGIKLDTQSTPNDPFIKYAKKIFSGSSITYTILLFFPFLTPLLVAFKIPISHQESHDFFGNIVTQALEERRQNPGKHSDFLQLMIIAENEAHNTTDSRDQEQNNGNVDTDEDGHEWKGKRKGKGLTASEIKAHAILFFSAGYDTTASTLAALFYHLAMNPEYMDQLIEEIDEHFPDGKRPDYESVNKLPYLEKVIMEGLRINPPFGRTYRVCNKETTVKGIKIPVGMGVALPIYQIHHDPGYWADPETFDPERFTSEKRQKHHPLQWIPFGYGPRNCLGLRLAQFEMKIAIIMLLQNFRVVPNEKTKPLKFGQSRFLLRTQDGIWLTIENRK